MAIGSPGEDNVEWVGKFIRTTKCPRTFARYKLQDMGGDEDYRAVREKIREIGERLREYAVEDPDAIPIFLSIRGNWGVGKTRMATWLLRQVYAGMRDRRSNYGGRAPLYLSATRAAELRFRNYAHISEDPQEEDAEVLRGRLFTSAFLVLDDVGRVAGYKGEEQYIQRIVEERWQEGKSTVLTISSVDDVLSPRFRDFLREFMNVIIPGESRRGS